MMWLGVALLPWVIFFVARGVAGRVLGLRARRLVLLDGPPTTRAVALLLGSVASYVLGVAAALVALNASTLEVPTPEPPVFVKAVLPGSPAAEAGMQAGDELLTLDGREVTSSAEVRRAIAASSGRPVVVSVRAGGNTRTVTVTPRASEGRFRAGFAMGRTVTMPPAAVDVAAGTVAVALVRHAPPQ